MLFSTNRHINKIQIPIVRVCNRSCPDCCAREELLWYNRQLGKPPYISLGELLEVGRTIGPIEWIEITGGEPSLHPDFKEISLNLREIFQAPSFMLVTNGFLFEREKKQLPLLLQYNSIFLTHYTDQFYTLNPNSGKPNTSAVTIIKEFLESEGYSGLQVIEMNSHKSMNVKVTNGTGCYHFHSNMIAYYEGILYGCCVSWSLPEKGTGVPLTREWRSELKNINLPCETCFLSKPQLSNSQKDSETRNLLNVLP